MESSLAPSHEVCASFGADPSTLERLTGGRGLTWRAENVVLRPHGDPRESTWKAQVLSELDPGSLFRVARPIPAAGGGWARDGWEASSWLPGQADESRVADVISAGSAFHNALTSLHRPAFIDLSDDPWSRADRMAWQEAAVPPAELLDRLSHEVALVHSPSQLVHGDLLGNVLFSPGLPPAIIDWAPYWRPAGWGAAIAAVDAACWHDEPTENLVTLGSGIAEWQQLLVRALIFRIATWHNLGRWSAAMDEQHKSVVDAVIELRR